MKFCKHLLSIVCYSAHSTSSLLAASMKTQAAVPPFTAGVDEAHIGQEIRKNNDIKGVDRFNTFERAAWLVIDPENYDRRIDTESR